MGCLTNHLVASPGPSALDCIEAAMRADPSLTIEEAIRTVPVSQETIDRYGAASGDGGADWCLCLPPERERRAVTSACLVHAAPTATGKPLLRRKDQRPDA